MSGMAGGYWPRGHRLTLFAADRIALSFITGYAGANLRLCPSIRIWEDDEELKKQDGGASVQVAGFWLVSPLVRTGDKSISFSIFF